MAELTKRAALVAIALVLTIMSPAAAQTNRPAEPARSQLFAIVLAPGPAWKPGKPFRDQGLLDHFRYWKTLFDQGRIVTAGPLGNDSGLVLLRAPSQRDADAILAADPAITAGIFNGTVRPYAPPMVNPAPLTTSPK